MGQQACRRNFRPLDLERRVAQGTEWVHHRIAIQEPNDPRLSFTCEEEPYSGFIMQYVMNTKTGEMKKILRQGDDLQGISYGTCKVKAAKSDLLLSHGDF